MAAGIRPIPCVGARLKCHRVCKVEMTPRRQGGLTRLHLSPEFCAMDDPLSAYPAPPDCLAAAGVVDRPADGLADMRLAALARTPAPRRLFSTIAPGATVWILSNTRNDRAIP